MYKNTTNSSRVWHKPTIALEGSHVILVPISSSVPIASSTSHSHVHHMCLPLRCGGIFRCCCYNSTVVLIPWWVTRIAVWLSSLLLCNSSQWSRRHRSRVSDLVPPPQFFPRSWVSYSAHSWQVIRSPNCGLSLTTSNNLDHSTNQTISYTDVHST